VGTGRHGKGVLGEGQADVAAKVGRKTRGREDKLELGPAHDDRVVIDESAQAAALELVEVLHRGDAFHPDRIGAGPDRPARTAERDAFEGAKRAAEAGSPDAWKIEPRAPAADPRMALEPALHARPDALETRIGLRRWGDEIDRKHGLSLRRSRFARRRGSERKRLAARAKDERWQGKGPRWRASVRGARGGCVRGVAERTGDDHRTSVSRHRREEGMHHGGTEARRR